MSSIKKRIILIFGSVWLITAIILAGYYFFVVSPKLNQFRSVKEKLDNIQSPEYIKQKQKQAERRLKYCTKIKNQIAGFIIDNDGWIDMMPYVSEIGRDREVSDFSSKDISGKNFEGYEDLKKVGVKTLSVNFQSNFLKFARFINNLESGQPVVFVKEFSIDRDPDDKGSNKVQMELRVITGKQKSQINKILAVADSNGSN